MEERTLKAFEMERELGLKKLMTFECDKKKKEEKRKEDSWKIRKAAKIKNNMATF